MALVQLFAWFSEQLIYRINKVPERTYIKFLQLLNLDAGQPSRHVPRCAL